MLSSTALGAGCATPYPTGVSLLSGRSSGSLNAMAAAPPPPPPSQHHCMHHLLLLWCSNDDIRNKYYGQIGEMLGESGDDQIVQTGVRACHAPAPAPDPSLCLLPPPCPDPSPLPVLLPLRLQIRVWIVLPLVTQYKTTEHTAQRYTTQ